MRKVTAILLAAVMLLALLSGCGQAAPSEPAEETPSPAETEALPVEETAEEEYFLEKEAGCN